MTDPELLSHLTFEPLTTSNWLKFLQLFGPKGACGNCWCMYYRLTKADWIEGKSNDGNKEAMHQLVRENRPTGMLGLYDGQAIAWAAFAPREDLIKLSRSRVHKRIDKQAVWSIPCLFIDTNFRKLGVSVELLKGVVAYAREKGIGIVEAYPTIPTKGILPDSFVWTGLAQSYLKAGFEVVDQTSEHRPMVRYYTIF